jgi:stage II sporulation protein D
MRKLGLVVPLVVLLGAAPAHAASRLVIRGAGFGHGIGMSQYGAFGLALQGVGYRAILSRYYQNTSLAELDRTPDVRVLLQGGRRSVKVAGAVSVGGRRLNPALTYRVVRRGAGLVIRQGGRALLTSAPPMRIAAPAGGSLVLEGVSVPGIRDGRYRGALELRPGSSGINVINALDLETYIRGVVGAESPASWPAEALKAQAVAARTYAITTRVGSLSDGFDQYADTRSQVYRGVAAETARTDAAISATHGQVVTYNGTPVTTYFFSTSGGHTENIENSFVGADPKPWLKGVEDPYDDLSPRHRWGPFTFTIRQVQQRLNGLVKGRFRRIRVLQRGTSPRVVYAQIVGSRGRTKVTGPTLRTRFGLFDTWASFRTVTTKVQSAAARGAAAAVPGAGGVVARGRATGRARVLTGSIRPGRRGTWVRVQRRTGGRWTTAVDTRLGRSGRYAVAVPGPGTYRVRAGGTVGPAVRAS